MQPHRQKYRERGVLASQMCWTEGCWVRRPKKRDLVLVWIVNVMLVPLKVSLAVLWKALQALQGLGILG